MSLSQDPITKVLGVQHKPGKSLKDGRLKQTKDTQVYIPIVETIQHLVSRSQTHPTASEGKGLVDYYRASRSEA